MQDPKTCETGHQNHIKEIQLRMRDGQTAASVDGGKTWHPCQFNAEKLVITINYSQVINSENYLTPEEWNEFENSEAGKAVLSAPGFKPDSQKNNGYYIAVITIAIMIVMALIFLLFLKP